MSKIERPRDVRRSYDKYTVKELSDMESSSSISEIHLKNNNTDIHANDVSAGVVRVEEESVDGDDRIYIHPRRDTDRTLKIYICIIWVLVCFGSPFAVSYLDFYAAIALGIGLINLFFYVLWGYSLWKSKELYSVKVLLKKIKHWLPISVPVGRTVKPTDPILSISEASAIRGSILYYSIIAVTCSVSIQVLSVSLYNIAQRNTTFPVISGFHEKSDFIVFFLPFSALGLVMISLFELSKFDPVHTIFHYLGVVLVLTGNLCFPFAEDWSWWSILGLIVLVGITALWFFSGYLLPEDTEDIRLVTLISKLSIGLEVLVFLLTTVFNIIAILELGHIQRGPRLSRW
eukprot:TRINITY_DN274_c1_g1_i2.p1 TRINITY_DN274_c1_g1~~TRINITY_DN274_c1_g1_i2.p1  ORF type:complete len:345 (+),score=58.98 TRINITY_DN274_c1_g1_i2:20-1054(+)